MEFKLENLVRENLRNLKPYTSLRDSQNFEAPVFLEANENPFGEYNRYPDSTQKKLKEKLSELKNISTENLFIGNGSDELIDLIIKAFCEPKKDEILVMNPSFVMYSFYAKINDNKVNALELDENFQIDKEDFSQKIQNENLKVLFLCSPNNPTGNELVDLEFFIENFSGIVVLDEAYIEFSSRKSAIYWLEKYPNLIVLQTLSKAYGMAGLRIGIGVASTEIAKLMNTIKGPYNVNSLSQKIALQQLNDEKLFNENIEQILAERELLKVQLNQFDFVKKIYPTEANFFLIKVENPIEIYEFLLAQNILTSLRHPQIENALRINVGSKEENQKLIETLKNYKK